MSDRVYLFTTSACTTDGVCQWWLPLVRERYGDRLVIIYNHIVPPELREEVAEVFARLMVRGVVVHDMPFLWDGKRVGRPGIEWEGE